MNAPVDRTARQQPLERGEPLVPLRAHLGHPRERLGHRSRGGAVEHLAARPACRHQAGVGERAQVLLDRLPGDGQLARRSVALASPCSPSSANRLRRVPSARAPKTASAGPSAERRRGAHLGHGRAGSADHRVHAAQVQQRQWAGLDHAHDRPRRRPPRARSPRAWRPLPAPTTRTRAGAVPRPPRRSRCARRSAPRPAARIDQGVRAEPAPARRATARPPRAGASSGSRSTSSGTSKCNQTVALRMCNQLVAG